MSDSLDDFYEAHHEQVEKTVMKLLKKPSYHDETKDALSDVWMAVGKSWDTFKGKSTRMTWVHTIIRRRVANHISKSIKLRKQKQAYLEGLHHHYTELERLLGKRVEFDKKEMEAVDTVTAIYNIIPLTKNQKDILTAFTKTSRISEVATIVGRTTHQTWSSLQALRKKLAKFYDVLKIRVAGESASE